MANNLTTEKKTLAISMLAEDSSIRAIERIRTLPCLDIGRRLKKYVALWQNPR
jgi:hypothetical protein